MTSSLFFPVSLVSVPFQPCPLHGTRHPCRDGTGARSLVHRFHADTRRHTQLPLAVSCSTAGPDRPVRRRSSARAVVSTLFVTRDIYPTRVLYYTIAVYTRIDGSIFLLDVPLSSGELHSHPFPFFPLGCKKRRGCPFGVSSLVAYHESYLHKFGDFRTRSSTIVVEPPSSVAILTVRPPINVTIT